MQYKDYAPKVCHDCRFLDGEPGEFGSVVAVYCLLNLYFPKKGSCKRWQPNKACSGFAAVRAKNKGSAKAANR